ncbi:MAG: hypothetical protein ABFS86_19765, partial [Planctomycetota bacterium]
SHIFFTPALVAGGLVVLWVYITFLAVGSGSASDVPLSFQTWCFLAGGSGALSIRTGYLLLVGALAAYYLVVLLGWLHEAHRDKWDAYLPWRLTAGLWAACVLALVAVLGTAVLRTPGPERIVAAADRAFAGGNGDLLHAALLRRVPGAERALRERVKSGWEGAAFEAAAILRVTLGRNAGLDRAMRDAVTALADRADMALPDDDLSGFRARLAAGLKRLEAEIPTSIVGEGIHLLQAPDSEAFVQWWRIHERLLFP